MRAGRGGQELPFLKGVESLKILTSQGGDMLAISSLEVRRPRLREAVRVAGGHVARSGRAGLQPGPRAWAPSPWPPQEAAEAKRGRTCASPCMSNPEIVSQNWF